MRERNIHLANAYSLEGMVDVVDRFERTGMELWRLEEEGWVALMGVKKEGASVWAMLCAPRDDLGRLDLSYLYGM